MTFPFSVAPGEMKLLDNRKFDRLEWISLSQVKAMADDIELCVPSQLMKVTQTAFSVLFNEEPIFTISEVLTITGVRERRLRNWFSHFRGRKILLDAEIKRQSGKHRRFSLRDVLRIALIDPLLRLGFSHPKASEIVEEYLAKETDDPIVITMRDSTTTIHASTIKARILAKVHDKVA